MKNLFLLIAMALILGYGCQLKNESKKSMENPLLSSFETPFQVPPFEQIKPEHYMPAFLEGMKQEKAAVEAIISNTEAPSFENTIEALENSDELLSRISSVFYNLTSAATSDELEKISMELAPIMSGHNDDIRLNETLFAKVKMVYEQRETLDLTTEQLTLVENTYKNFVRGGANLDEEAKTRFREINKELSVLFLNFGQNVLKENNRFMLVIDNEADLAGLSSTSIAAAAKKAKEKDLEGKWVFTIHKPSLLPFLANAENRDLRQKMFEAYINKANYDDSLDNKAIINDIVNLRIEKAQLLGYENFSAYILDKNMAKNADNVYKLLDQIMPNALRVAKKEVADMQKMIAADGHNFKLAPWDYDFYATKVKQEKFALNENEIRPYLKLDNVRDGMFWVANQLYGISFTQLENMPVYHPEVEVFEVKEENGDHVGILYMDYHPRESKRSGAWCTSYRSQKYENGERVAPVMSIVCNFSAPTADAPALLTVDETETLFHEFGHALDGLFANKHYASLRTPRDFVELPSQIMEHWAFEPEVLNHYAKHYQSGESMPAELITKIEKAGKFNQGFATTEYLAASYLDLDWHTQTQVQKWDVNAFEAAAMKKINMIDEIVPRYRSPYFLHVFSGDGYASAYYSYIWAEVLDADAFEAFKEHGIFDKTTASAFRTNVLELGGTEDAMELYKKFRGSEPGIQPLLNNRGLN